MPSFRWVIVTGEYPPQVGGVSDYTRQVARSLAAAGDEVHVLAPASAQPAPNDAGVAVHRLPDGFSLRGLAGLSVALDHLPRPYRLLVQYVPHNFGWKGMNLPFCLWLFSKRRDPIWIMFHEVAFPVSRAQPFRHNILGVTTSVMASVIARSAKRIFVSTPGWERLVRRIAPNPAPITWLPVPSNLPVEADSDAVSAVRAKLAPFPGMVVLGHFGTYGSHIAPMLGVVLPPLLLADPRRVVLLLGRGAEAFADEMARVHPGLRRRFHTIADPSGESIATHLSACDVLVQPYPDGACSRRTSLMAGLALGRPIITTDGRLTEPIWKEAGAVGLAPASSAPALVAAVEALLADPEARTKLAVRAARMYADHFALERTVATLRSAPS